MYAAFCALIRLYPSTSSHVYHLIETINPDGTEVRTVYDAMGRPIWVTDAFNPANGNPSATETIYGSLGQAIETLRYRDVDIEVSADPTYSGVYDESFTPPTGSPVSTTQTFYTPQGQVDHQIGADGQTTQYTYYPNGQQHTVTTAAGTALAATTTYAYHTAPTTGNNGDYQLVTDALGNTTRTDFDAQGRTVQVTYDVNADGTIPSGAIFTSTSYGLYGQTVTSTDELGRQTVSKYDDAGNLIEVDQPAVPDPANGNAMTTPVTKYGYDIYGDETSQTDANDHVTDFTYDALGQQTGRTLPDDESETTTYDDFGRVLTSTDFKGQTTAYAYDDSATGDGRMSGEYFFAAGVSALDGSDNIQTSLAADSTLYTYDNLGRQSTVTDDSGTTTDHYDADGNLTEEDTPEGVINHVFDPATGRLIETYTDNTDTLYAYDAQGRLSTIAVDKLNGQTLSTPLVTTDTYDADGNKQTETLPNGIVTDYTYDGMNRLTDEVQKLGSTTLFSQQFVLNPDGTRASLHETQVQSDGSTTTTDTDWSYDALDRLTNEVVTSSQSGQSYSNVFAYDLVGNRVSETHTGPGDGADESIAYTYNPDDQLTKQVSSLSGETDFAYDADGNQIDDGTHKYIYNVQNKLSGITDESNNVVASYVYDADGNRVSETTGGTTTLYLSDNNNPTGYAQPIEQKSSPTAVPSITYILGDHVLAQADASGAVSYLLTDGHGSTRALADFSGAITTTFGNDKRDGSNSFDIDASRMTLIS